MSRKHDIDAAVRRPGGDPAVRCLALLHGAACAGRLEVVPDLIALAASLGVQPGALGETALQVVAYGGFPRAIELLTHLQAAGVAAGATAGPPDPADAARPIPDPTFAPAVDPGDTPALLAARGRDVWDAIYARQADEVLATLERLLPGFPQLVVQDAYGRILARPGLSLATRELLAVAALTLMALPAPLGSHIRGALRNGSNAPAVLDILDTCRVLADPVVLPVLEQAQDRLSRSVYRP